jgi:hypothetical protein
MLRNAEMARFKGQKRAEIARKPGENGAQRDILVALQKDRARRLAGLRKSMAEGASCAPFTAARLTERHLN